MGKSKEINHRIGANIKLVRERAGYTQEQFSEALGVTPNHLSALERGTCGASLELLDRLCRLFHVSADFLFFGPVETDGAILTLAQKLGQTDEAKRVHIQDVLLALLALSENS